ncbi:MAG: insulinase family protein [Deltaproteobacteria bacterium]|nr:insulinase family protein [Deltaproteobacteria bacterium]
MNRKTVLENGVRIVSERLPHVRSVSLGIWVNTGSRDESPLENGVSHFIEHMSFKGTRNRSGFQIAKDLDAIGGFSNAFTGKETTCFYGKVLDRNFPILADILSDIFVHPTFHPEDMAREREVIFQEISMVEDTPDDHLNLLFQGLFWPDHPIGRSVLGSAETVARMDPEMIREYIRKYYVPERVLVVAAGNVDHDKMVDYFRPIFETDGRSSGDNPPRSLPKAGGGVLVTSKPLEQVHLFLGGDAPSQVDESRFACALLNTILGGNMSSRLFQEIRENRGLAYSVYSFFSPYADAGLFGVYAATDARNMNSVLEITQNEIRKLSRGQLSASDLADAKENVIGGMYLASESSDSRMMRAAKNEFVFKRYVAYEEVVDNIERVSVDDVVEMANKIFGGDPIAFAALGPITEKDVDLGCLALSGNGH